LVLIVRNVNLDFFHALHRGKKPYLSAEYFLLQLT